MLTGAPKFSPAITGLARTAASEVGGLKHTTFSDLRSSPNIGLMYGTALPYVKIVIRVQGDLLKIGVIGYSNICGGVGVFCKEFLDYLNADSLLSIREPTKGQEQWTERQFTVSRPPTDGQLADYFATYRPDVVMYIETPFSEKLYPMAHSHGCKVVGIVMHETYMISRLEADLLVCPCETAFTKAHGNKQLLFLPIGLKMFPFKLRTGHTFVASIGYGGVNDRRQVAKIVEAFTGLKDPEARLIINSQADLPRGVKITDSRITLNQKTYPEPKDIYAEGDIAISPIAYGGYERGILEAMASGMPCLTTNADPMNLFQHDPDFLIDSCKKWTLNGQWVTNTVYNEVSADALREKMNWLLTIDTQEYSRWARAQAEAQSWECEAIPYLETWLEAIGSVL